MAKNMPMTKLVSEMCFRPHTTDHLMNEPFVRSLGRLEGIQNLRTDEGQELIGRIEALYTDRSSWRLSASGIAKVFEWQSRLR